MRKITTRSFWRRREQLVVSAGKRCSLRSIVAGREHVAGDAAQRVYVVVEEDQNDGIDGGVRPGQERQQLVDFRRLLELWIDEGEDVEWIPGEDEEHSD